MACQPSANQIQLRAVVTKVAPNGSSVRAMTYRNCPRCGRSDVRESRRRGVLDRLLACVGLAPYRCRACRHRFYRFPAERANGVKGSALRSTSAASPEPLIPEPVLQLTPPQQAETWPFAGHVLSRIPVARSLLIVSPDPAVRKLLSKVLAQAQYHTHELADSARLSIELEARKVDVLIIDLELPEQQALEAVSVLRIKYPGLKIIALSGNQLAGAPGSIILPKPFHRELLLESIETALLEAAGVEQPKPTR